MHMKESPTYPSNHLKDTINYILDVKNGGKKTEYGMWVGGNVGTDAGTVYRKFMETKRAFGKEHGRQGYHFVISFAPGETDEATCHEVMRKFCEEYLGNDYEYVFAVHNDKDHVHGHIVFNSVSRTEGSKYRYEKGDWEKFIQPITDKITKEHGLAPLEFKEKREGKVNAEWSSKKNEDITWTRMIRADVDLAIKNSNSMEEFFVVMKEMGYSIRTGMHKKKDGTTDPYFTFCFTDEKGKVHRRRSYSLLPGTDDYSIANIKARIEDKTKLTEPYYEQMAQLLEQKLFLHFGKRTPLYGFKTYNRLYQAVSYYRLANPFAVPSYQVRKDIMRIDSLIDECIYIRDNPPKSIQEFSERESNLDAQLKSAYIRRKELRKTKEEFEMLVPKEQADNYYKLKKCLSETDGEDDAWEVLADEIEVLEENLPAAFISIMDDLVECEAKIKMLRNEKKILGRVIQMEGTDITTEMQKKFENSTERMERYGKI